MSDHIIHVADNFWNIRGKFKIAGLIDIGTHSSLVRRENGKFIFLDSYTLKGSLKQEVDRLTNDGQDVETVINLHPFHTVNVKWMHEHYPGAQHYGTARHLQKFPELDWQSLRSEDPELHDLFSGDIEFSVPRGVDFISTDENVHFSSVLAFHRSSRTLHIDDTLLYIRLPSLLSWFGLSDAVSFHPTLSKVLEKRKGAARDFIQWAEELAERWKSAQNLCAAHTATLLAGDDHDASIHDRIIRALDRAGSTLSTHERKFG